MKALWEIRRLWVGAAAVFVVLAVASIWYVRRTPTDPPPAPDYDRAADWLCRPGRADPCAAPTTATALETNGGRRIATYAPDRAAPIDCFYLYPTVSRVPAAYAPVAATEAEGAVARRQLARFSSVCRTFAPLYRQVTLRGLPLLFGGERGVTLDTPYADVAAAWRSYLAHDNAGRGVVLIGHSQGARLLKMLLAREIDGKPVASRIVSAIIPGTTVDVPPGQRVGGTFRHLPLCAAAAETGCIIAYSSYPADREIPADARFGISPTPGMRAACVDPAALAKSATLDADLPVNPALRERFGTDFIEVPGVIGAACRDDGRFSELAIAARSVERGGEKVPGLIASLAAYQPTVGYHNLDINLALGTLVDLVRRQTATYAAH